MKTATIFHKFSRLAAISSVMWSGYLPLANAATDLADIPVFLSNAAKSNIIMAIDDSGSMDSEVILPNNDGALWWNTTTGSFWGLDANDNAASGSLNYNKVGTASATWKKFVYLFPNGTTSSTGGRAYASLTNDHFPIPPTDANGFARSPDYNTAYYNPKVRYTPWPSYGTHTFNNITPSAAPYDPSKASSQTIDLTADMATCTDDNWKFATFSGTTLTLSCVTYFPATYYLKDDVNGTITLPDSHKLKKYEIKSANASFTGSTSRTDCAAAPSCTYTEEIQNFANWFSYYRKRHLAMRGGAISAFESVARLRVGAFTFNNRTNVSMYDLDTQRNSLYDAILAATGSGGTPTRESLAYAGEQFRRTDASAPIQYACQRNIAMIFTDGFANASTTSGAGNQDGTEGAPYADTYSNTLADIAMWYYKGSTKVPLRTGASFPTGKVLPIPEDTSTNLHMNTYAIGLGTKGTLDSTVDPFTTTPVWPNPSTDRSPTAVDDLWHATINGRGDYLSVSDGAGLKTAFSQMLQSVVSRDASASAVSVNSATITDGTRVYRSTFHSGTWTGNLNAYTIDAATGQVSTSSAWSQSALDQINGNVSAASDSRRIISSQTVSSVQSGITFQWASLTTGAGSQQAYLNNDQDLLGFIRGQRKDEGGKFRSRTGILGDLVDSQPIYVGSPPFFYTDPSYLLFRADKASRTPMLYVGGNDGMLHAFYASTGREAFAYVPDILMPTLKNLATKPYVHNFFVNGTPTFGDIKIGTANTAADWQTLLVTGLGKGGKGYFALDITTPPTTTATESDITSKFKWEFSDATDLGYTYGRPLIINTQAAGWVVAFTSGYNNTSGLGVLFLVNAQTGALIRKINTDNALCSSAAPCGLGQATAVDLNGDGYVDAIYAGDLKGNMWKFDLSDATSSAQWGVAYKQGTTPKPLATVADASGTAQPITSAPEVTIIAATGNPVVLFGTGRYLGTSDITDVNQLSPHYQSFYAVKDAGKLGTLSRATNGTMVNKSPILQTLNSVSVILSTTTTDSPINWSTKDGWYMDFPTSGERLVSDPQLRYGQLIFTTFIPDSDACNSGGTSYLYDFDYLTGTAFDDPSLDINGDYVLNDSDSFSADITQGGKTYKRHPVGKSLGQGQASQPTIIAGDKLDIKLIGKSDTTVQSVFERAGTGRGRVSWRQLQ